MLLRTNFTAAAIPIDAIMLREDGFMDGILMIPG
jgi:hypothetical protein